MYSVAFPVPPHVAASRRARTLLPRYVQRGTGRRQTRTMRLLLSGTRRIPDSEWFWGHISSAISPCPPLFVPVP